MERIFIEGVACVGKTALLKTLKEQGHSVGFLDFCEFRQECGTSRDHEYPNWYKERVGQYSIVDRSPYSSFIYQVVWDPSLVLEELIKDVKIDGKYIVFLVRPGDEPHVVEAMRRRDNKIDDLSISYVSRQNEVFKEFVRLTGVQSIEVAFNENGPITDSFVDIVNKLVY